MAQDIEIGFRSIIKIGLPVISALAKGMRSKVKGIVHDCCHNPIAQVRWWLYPFLDYTQTK
jgi:hypothetical protein